MKTNLLILALSILLLLDILWLAGCFTNDDVPVVVEHPAPPFDFSIYDDGLEWWERVERDNPHLKWDGNSFVDQTPHYGWLVIVERADGSYETIIFDNEADWIEFTGLGRTDQ